MSAELPVPAAAGAGRRFTSGLDARLQGWLGLASIGVAWLFANPYLGTRHDAILYLGGALRRLQPEIFDQDLYFRFGSQDRFTWVSLPFAWLLHRFGADVVEMGLTLACNLSLAGAAWLFCGTLRRELRWLCTLCVALLPHTYTPLSQFSFAEPFFTARSAAEPLTLLALLAWTSRRHAAAAALFALAMATHPLIALPGLVTAWLMRVLEDRRWLWALATAVPVAALAFAGVAPFDALLHRFDDAWWGVVEQASVHVLMSRWPPGELAAVAFDLVVVALAWRWVEPRAVRLLQALVGATLLLSAISVLAGDLARDVFVVQLQLWRIVWLLHLAACACAPVVVLRLVREPGGARLLAAAIVATIACIAAAWPLAWLFVGWTLLALYVWRVPQGVAPRVLQSATIGTVIATVVFTVVFAVTVHRMTEADAMLIGRVAPAVAVLTIPTLSLLLWLAGAVGLQRTPTWAASLVLLALAAGAAVQWDERSDWTRTLESTAGGAHPFDRFVPPDAQVYWHTELLPTWLMLRRASWVSSWQGSGVIFNRGTALAFEQRARWMDALLEQQVACQMAADARGLDVVCQPPVSAVVDLCRQPDGPDFVVLDAAYPRGLVAQWTYRTNRYLPARTAYLHACAQMR